MKLSTFRPQGTRPARFGAVCAPLFALGLLALTFAGSALGAPPVPLGNAATFGALSATAMTDSGGLTVVNGDIGSSGPIDVGVTNGIGSTYLVGSTEVANAQASLLTAYGVAAAATPDQATITGSNLAGQTLHPGVYNSTSSILISGPTPLTLDGNGDPGSVFIFQAGSDLTVDPTSSVTLTNGAQACNVFWQVGSSAFLKNSGSVFTGTILALTQITLTDGITVNGRLLARNADVTFIHDTVNTPTTCAPPNLTREIYCAPGGQTYDLVYGEDKRPPYDQLGLLPAHVDPVTGSKSCDYRIAAPPTAPAPTPPPPVAPPPPPTPTPVTPKPAPKPKPKPATIHKVKSAAFTKKAALFARPAVRHVGLTG